MPAIEIEAGETRFRQDRTDDRGERGAVERVLDAHRMHGVVRMQFAPVQHRGLEQIETAGERLHRAVFGAIQRRGSRQSACFCTPALERIAGFRGRLISVARGCGACSAQGIVG